MIRSLIISSARKAANDTDSSNPFHSDTELLGFIDDWGIELASFLKWPRAQQTTTFAVGDGPSAGNIVNAKNLNTDIVSILSVYFENLTTSVVSRLVPKYEPDIQAETPQWRYPTGNALPRYYVLLDSPTEQAANWPQSQITIDTPTAEARTMRIHYIQAPAAVTDQTKSPIFPPQYHKTAVYYLAAQMLLPRNAQRAEYFMQKYLDERRKQKSLTEQQQDDSTQVWDMVQVFDRAIYPIIR